MKRKNEVLEKIEKAEKNLNTLKNKKKRKTKIILSTTFALAGAAVIITPIVIYKKENSAYEVFIESLRRLIPTHLSLQERWAWRVAQQTSYEGALVAKLRLQADASEDASWTHLVQTRGYLPRAGC